MKLVGVGISISTALTLLLCFILASVSVTVLLNTGRLEYDVRVINGFRNNSSEPLVVWCVSTEGRDLGGRALQEGDDYSWIHHVGRVLWPMVAAEDIKCTVKWEQRRRRFDAFKVVRDRYRCIPLGKCSWLVKEDGFYFSRDDVIWTKDFTWS